MNVLHVQICAIFITSGWGYLEFFEFPVTFHLFIIKKTDADFCLVCTGKS